MDCFASLAMTLTRVYLLAARCARGLHLASLENRGRRECRVPDAPAAARVVVVSTRVSHHGHAGSPGIPPAMVLTAYFVLSPVTGLSCHRRRRNFFRQLDASVGASGPHDFAVRISTARLALLPRPPHPCPTFVTIAKRPSVWAGMANDIEVIWVKREREYFSIQGWTLIC